MDDGQDRIHIVRVDANGTRTELAETDVMNIRTDDLGTQSGRMWVDYCDDEVLRVYVNTTGSTKPLEPQAQSLLSLREFFDGNDVVVGYTAGTWAQADYQDILDWQFIQSPSLCSA